MAVYLWNANLKSIATVGVWSFILLFTILITVSSSYVIFLKTTNKKSHENFINQQVEEERTKILAEFNKQEEQKESSDNSLEQIEKINQILPKGNFKNLDTYAKKLLVNLADELEVTQGIIYLSNPEKNSFSFLAGYALTNIEPIPDFQIGENLCGQVAASKEIMIVNNIPEDYFRVESGLGKSQPRNLIIMPILSNGLTIGILEVSLFHEITNLIKDIISKVSDQASEKMVQIQKL
jgi:transcriptional regulator with GAF, ATPase, and Fis domain